MSDIKLSDIATEIVNKIADDYQEHDGDDFDFDSAVNEAVFEWISDQITTDEHAAAVVSQIDLNGAPEGETLFRAIQKAAEGKLRVLTNEAIERESRFADAPGIR